MRCAVAITTIEAPDMTTTLVVRYADGSTKPFCRDVLFLSLYAALGHRSSAVADATALTTTVISHLMRKHHSPAVQPKDIVQSAHTTLRRFDAAAAVSYAAYHQWTG